VVKVKDLASCPVLDL